MKQSEIIELTLDELKDKLLIESEAFDKMRMTHAISTLENPIQLRLKKKNIARLNTELRKRELEAKK
jgi:large subunit ribosomal protein L29